MGRILWQTLALKVSISIAIHNPGEEHQDQEEEREEHQVGVERGHRVGD